MTDAYLSVLLNPESLLIRIHHKATAQAHVPINWGTYLDWLAGLSFTWCSHGFNPSSSLTDHSINATTAIKDAAEPMAIRIGIVKSIMAFYSDFLSVL